MPDSHRPPRARIAAPSPPAAPAARAARRARAGSRAGPVPAPPRNGPGRRRAAARRRGSAPFCGPNTVLAPCGPSSGLSTSVAATSRTPRSRGAPSSAAHGGQRRPAVRQRVARPRPAGRRPSAASRPAPPSLVAEPPSPITTRRAPLSTAAATSSAQPVRGGGLRVALGRGRAGAGRTPGRSPRRRSRRRRSSRTSPATGRPSGSTVGTGTAGRRGPRRARRRSPGPPSASGRIEQLVVRRRRSRQPSATAAATSGADRVPANLSGQMQHAHAEQCAQATPTRGCVALGAVGPWRA